MQKPMTTADLLRTVAGRHARTYPHGCPMLCEACATRLHITAPETEVERLRRVRRNIAAKYGHQGPEVRRG
jgi:hypothetical protein